MTGTPLRAATLVAALLVSGAARLPAPVPAAAPAVAGTWIGTLRIAGVPRKLAMQLHRRANNEVYGYVLGGTSGLSISGGRLTGSRLTLNLVAKDPGGATSFAISGSIAGASFAGTARTGAAIQPVHWTRQPAGTMLHERRVFFALQGPEGDPVGLTELAVALDGAGRLVAGGFVGVETCALFGCAGGVRTFRDVGDVLDVGLHPAGGCAAGSALHATFDPESRFYAGSFTINTCPGTRSEDLLGARGTRARSDHVAAMLATLAGLADDLEARRTFGAAHPAFLASYLHSGTRLGARLAELNAQTHGYNPLKVTLDRFRAASSVDDPTTLDRLDRAFGLDFHDRRSGKPVGGGPTVVLRDSDMENLLVAELRYLRQSGAAWVLSGDQLPAFDLPFEYALGGDHLEVATAGGTVYVSLGPWGAHFQPLTGHAYGDAKPNLAGLFSHSTSDLVELEGNGDGVRQPGEVWGYFGGADGSLVRSRVPVLRSPYAGKVVEVIYDGGPAGVYFDNPPHWRLEVSYPNGLTLSFVHLARLAPPLRAAVLAATGIDTDTYPGPPGELLDGSELPIARHTALASPQVFAQVIPGHPGYYRGGGSFSEVPWAQMEFFLHGPVAGPVSADLCVYQHLLPARKAALQRVLDAEVANPGSWRFTAPFTTRWQWGAEGALCNAYSTHPDGFASLHTRLGGWFERGAPGTTADEIFAIVPIAKGAAAYRAADYSSPAVSHLVLRRRRNTDGPFSWTLPGGIVAHQPYPAGEVLAQTATALLVKWRDIVTPGDAWYQRAAYRLDGAGLKIEWGAFAASAAAAPVPVLAPGEPCNDTTVLCYDHQHRPGF